MSCVQYSWTIPGASLAEILSTKPLQILGTLQGPNLKTGWTVSLCSLKIEIISHFNCFELHNIMSRVEKNV